jgi:ketopantoate reductase
MDGLQTGALQPMRLDPVDVLFVFTKTHHTVPALDSVRHLIGAR